MKRCSLCGKSGTDANQINKHHVKGKRYPQVMPVHTHTCHWFAQWVTNSYVQMGRVSELSEALIVSLYATQNVL